MLTFLCISCFCLFDKTNRLMGLFEIGVLVNNIGANKEFFKRVSTYVESDKDFFEKAVLKFLEEDLEIFTVSNIKDFVEREFVDIEKIRIYARQLIREELPYIKAISLFDKVIVEEHENFALSIRHASLHGLFSTLGELTHSTENHLALTFYRENIVSSLLKVSRRSDIPTEIKMVENTYLAILSGLKHFIIYDYLIDIGFSSHLKREVELINKFYNKDLPTIQKLKFLSTIAALEMNHHNPKTALEAVEESLIEILEEQMSSVLKHKNLRKRIEALIGSAFRVYTFLKKIEGDF